MFLDRVAQYIAQIKQDELERTCLVFPNRRSGLFLKKYLMKEIRGAGWLPGIQTINEFMQKLSSWTLADRLDLIFDVYDAYKSLAENPDPFDAFYPWGEMMISDFDTLDKYLADPHAVFKNIRELKEIDEQFGGLEEEQIAFIRKFWKSFHSGDETKEKAQFLATWKLLPAIYDKLRAILSAREEGYEGMLYRKTAELDIISLDAALDYDNYFFIGFNALSSSEKRLFSILKEKGVAIFFWDFDSAYISDPHMEAGRFLRDNMRLFPPPLDFELSHELSSKKDIRIFDLPSDMMQAKTVHKLLSERVQDITDANDMAIIACDENLLMPILLSLPSSVEEVNITMGYPFKNTPLSTFMEAILSLQKNARKTKSDELRFYHKDVFTVLNHQYFQLISQQPAEEYIQDMVRNNMMYISSAYFEEGFVATIFKSVSSAVEFCSYLGSLLRYILQKLVPEGKNVQLELEREYVLVMLSKINKLDRLLARREFLTKETFTRIFRQLISGLRIPFTGEPLAGLQLMGILETRLLDFKHVIMLSVNEEVMPKSSQGSSFIPYSLRYAYNLPVREDMDAIYAYYFYRVIQRAEKVDLLYNSSTEGIQSGEMSRYLYQMKYDYLAPLIRPSLPLKAAPVKEVLIEKSPAMMKELDKYLSGNEKGRFLSPSALNSYVECSLRFYFRKVLNMKEQDVILEELDAIGIGNILHHTIHELYKPYKDQGISLEKTELDKLYGSADIRHILRKEFDREFHRKKGQAPEGRNLIILAILEKYVRKIIQTDSQIAPLEILDLEEDYLMDREISLDGKDLKIAIGGQIDRIDRIQEGAVRIIDYKTGSKPNLKFNSIESLFDKENKNRNKEAFQAFLYAALYQHKNPEALVRPGLYIIKDLFTDGYTPEFRMGEGYKKEAIHDFSPHEKVYLEGLDKVLEEIFDPSIPFSQTEVKERCKHCDFNKLCARDK